MRHTYSRLGCAHWEAWGDPAPWLVPDHVMAPLLDGLLATLPDIDHENLKSQRMAAINTAVITKTESVAFVGDLWREIGGEHGFAAVSGLLAQKPIRPIPEDNPFFGKSGGHTHTP